MHWFTAVLVYTMIWWTVLFAVLPVGIRPVSEADEVTGWRGAPSRPLIGRKLFATTAISAVLWGMAMGVIWSGLVSLRP